jgi:hypothetical protein
MMGALADEEISPDAIFAKVESTLKSKQDELVLPVGIDWRDAKYSTPVKN